MDRRSFLKRATLLFAAVATAPVIEKAIMSLAPAEVEKYSAMSDAQLFNSDMLSRLKEFYSGPMLHELVYKDNPFLKLVSKEEPCTGSTYPIPIIYGKEES